MGADLYARSQFGPQYERWVKRFEKAVADRDRLKEGTDAERRAQRRVEYCYDKMHEQGYFRDSYNSSNLLWQFGLSWWEHVGELLDNGNFLSVRNAQRLLGMLTDRETLFEDNLSGLRPEERRYFRRKYQTFRQFLTEAIQRDEPIDCSI